MRTKAPQVQPLSPAPSKRDPAVEAAELEEKKKWRMARSGGFSNITGGMTGLAPTHKTLLSGGYKQYI